MEQAETRDDILVACGVRKIYRTGALEVEALRRVDLTVTRGEFVAVMGPSGSGKTTLLNCLSGLDDIDEGTVAVEGQDLHAMRDGARTAHRARRMGFIFQAFNLIPVLSAVENVELPLLLNSFSSKDARRRAQDVLDRVGLSHRYDHRPTELSGGEQQRVTVARALAIEPALVWADEPTGNLDTQTADNVLELLSELHSEGLTLILVTHDPAIGGSAQRLIAMTDGAIVSDRRLGDEDLPYHQPAQRS
ncbi:MAG: ATP-binding cassette domain-containing protein [Nitriliruptorales bacterium]|nr:ATP-binding cassette domain-containing protein [Nitriliruptorales bacterium]